jgi:putative ABC transport system permease protein
MAYSVTERTREIGIRMALGAASHDVLKMVMRHTLVLVAIGLVLGLAGSFALTRLIKSGLYGVTPTDPATYVGISLLLIIVAMLACLVPTLRAVRVDPTVALRYE